MSVDAQPFVEALDQPAVVELQRDRRHRQAGQRLGHDLGDLDVVVERQRVPRRRCRCRPGGTRGSGPPAAVRPARPSGSGSAGTGTRSLPAFSRTYRANGTVRSKCRAERSASAAARRGRRAAGGRRRPPCRSRPCAAAGERLDRAGLERREAGQLEGTRAGGRRRAARRGAPQAATPGSRTAASVASARPHPRPGPGRAGTGWRLVSRPIVVAGP